MRSLSIANYRCLSICVILLLMVLTFSSPVLAGKSIEDIKHYVDTFYKAALADTPHVMASEIKQQMERGEKFILVDVRTQQEYDAGHIQGAIHIDRGLLEWYAPVMLVDIDANIFVYCKGGARSALATKRLLEIGYTRVTNIYDGFMGWVQKGYSVFNRHGEFVMAPEGFEKKE